MGRYYSGDIEGKFWLGIQSSTDGEFFGAVEDDSHRDYFADDIETAEKGVETCIKTLGAYKEKIDEFFEDKQTYTKQELAEYLCVDLKKVYSLLEWYARLRLGIQIRDCIKEQGSCYFNAEM